MKKIIGILFCTMLLITVFSADDVANATTSKIKPVKVEQVVFTRKCCDGGGNVRCFLDNWTPVGNSCFCYGQGWGYAC